MSRVAQLKRLVGAAIGVAAIIVLCGCENPRVGPLAIQVQESDLVVTVCAPISATRLWFEEKGSDWGGDWRTFWKEDVRLALDAGDQISTNPAVTSLAEGGDRSTPQLSPGNRIDIEVKGATGKASQLAAQFTIPESGLSSSSWLHPDGSMTAEACP